MKFSDKPGLGMYGRGKQGTTVLLGQALSPLSALSTSCLI